MHRNYDCGCSFGTWKDEALQCDQYYNDSGKNTDSNHTMCYCSEPEWNLVVYDDFVHCKRNSVYYGILQGDKKDVLND